MASYYPEAFNISKIVRKFPQLEMVDEDEVERFANIAELKKRGKGAPKKAKSDSGCFLSFLVFSFGWFDFVLTDSFLFR